jgi:hypothetical protein
MSDAQSILLILIGFYLFECLKWAPLGALAMTSRGIRTLQWHVQQATVQFFGIKKSMFVAPILPAIQIQLITDKAGDGGHTQSKVQTALGVQRRLFRLRIRTMTLRILSAYTFITYFVCLPALYIKFGEGSYVYITVGLGYVLQAMCAICYFSVHRRFFPKARGGRWLHSFYNLVLPWHAMRASDELFIQSSLDWSELAILGASARGGEADQRLSLYWRQSKLLAEPIYSSATLSPIFTEIGLSTEVAMRIEPAISQGKSFCPCCAVLYEGEVTKCVDCMVPLVKES